MAHERAIPKIRRSATPGLPGPTGATMIRSPPAGTTGANWSRSS
jgi:hypothetical protein